MKERKKDAQVNPRTVRYGTFIRSEIRGSVVMLLAVFSRRKNTRTERRLTSREEASIKQWWKYITIPIDIGKYYKYNILIGTTPPTP